MCSSTPLTATKKRDFRHKRTTFNCCPFFVCMGCFLIFVSKCCQIVGKKRACGYNFQGYCNILIISDKMGLVI